MSKLKIGLIGFGKWVRSAYLPALKYDGRAVVTAVTASSEKTKQLARETLGGGVTIFDDYKELLSKAEVDAVMVAVPDDVHEEILKAALESEITVFYEPPIANTREQISVMTESLLAAKQVTYAHLELCFHRGINRALELVKRNAIGALSTVTVNLYANWGASKHADLCLLSRMSCWYVDVLNFLTESQPKRVLVLDGYGNSGRMQTISTGIYDYNGVWGVIKANVKSAEGVAIIIEISGFDGDIEIDYFSGELRYRSPNHSEWISEDCSPQKPYADWPGVRETVSAFIDAAISENLDCGNAKAVAALSKIGLAADESKDTENWAEVKA